MTIPRAARSRGFTLMELMIVVVIVGILAMIGGYGVSRYIASSKTSEAIQVIGAVKAAQESYKDETFQYLAVAADVTSDSSFYPHKSDDKPGQTKVMWGAGDDTLARNWRELGVNPGAVLFAYACTAGSAGSVQSPGSDINIGNWPATLGQPWYIVKAKADLVGGPSQSIFVGVSFTNQIFANEGE